MDAFLLARLACEISRDWTGAWIQGVWQDLDGRITLKLRGRGKTRFLLLSPHPEVPGIGLVENRPPSTQAPPAVAAYLRAHARGGQIDAVRTLPFERVVEAVIRSRTGEHRIYLEAIERRGNLVVCDPEGTVRVVSRSERSPLRTLTPGAPYRPPPRPPGRLSPDAVSPGDLTAWLATGIPLHRRVLGLGSTLAREIVARAGKTDAWSAYRSVVDGYGTFTPIYEYAEGLSVVPLTRAEPPLATHALALDRAGVWLLEQLQQVQDQIATRTAERRQRSFRDRIERRLTKIQAELARLSDPIDLRARADALAASFWAIKRGDRQVELPDPVRPERCISLTLNPSRTPGENLNDLYRIARRAERTKEHLARRLQEARRELEAGPQAEADTRTRAKPGTEGPYRRYLSSDRLTIWVGRNGAENDRLLRDARPWDLWMHVRDAAGAHVLVRKPGREARVPERSLVEAAGLAALYSRRSGESKVEVMVTEVARVRKPKGASPGKVLVAGERTLRVPPGAGNPRPTHRKGSRT